MTRTVGLLALLCLISQSAAAQEPLRLALSGFEAHLGERSVDEST